MAGLEFRAKKLLSQRAKLQSQSKRLEFLVSGLEFRAKKLLSQRAKLQSQSKRLEFPWAAERLRSAAVHRHLAENKKEIMIGQINYKIARGKLNMSGAGRSAQRGVHLLQISQGIRNPEKSSKNKYYVKIFIQNYFNFF